ncbi:MAG: hypothetical protein MUC85_10115 [Anaerolineales bacterium]|jgi:protein-tyrosine phosphatase|nr:hypothetical protein [Anaerolineales bacterium]
MQTTLTELPFGLSGKIYRSPMPYGHFDPAHTVMDLYHSAGVDIVVMLVSDQEAREKTGRDLKALYAVHGLDVIHLPTPDFSVPPADALLPALRQAQAEASAGRNLAVHCNAGIGRTGLFMACLARRVFGMNAAQAVDWVRQHIDGAVEDDVQYALVESLAVEPMR